MFRVEKNVDEGLIKPQFANVLSERANNKVNT